MAKDNVLDPWFCLLLKELLLFREVYFTLCAQFVYSCLVVNVYYFKYILLQQNYMLQRLLVVLSENILK